jgi:1-deoxyxylulose-5-phosphate synthase
VRSVPLGTTGIEVSEFFFGAGGIGGIGSSRAAVGRGLTLQQGLDRMDEAWERGIRVIDTANSYAAGASESAVGRWLGEREPDGAIVATKVGFPVDPGRDRVDLSAAHIARQLATSVRRLGRVDLYLWHAPDPETPLVETIGAFASAIESGTIRAWGVSNVTPRDLEAVLSTADDERLPRPGWVQNGFNLAMRGDERDLLPLVRGERLGYTPYSPLAGGILSDRYLKGAEPVPGSRIAVARGFYADYLTDAVLDRVQALSDMARDYDVSTSGLALAWLTRHPDVTAPIVSPRTAAQWQAVDEAVELELGDDDLDRIGALFPS